MDLVGKQIGNYVAKSVLGRGGMGVVYLAEHPVIGRKVAVKVLHEDLAVNEQMVQRLWLEAKSASEIDSEHIVEVLDFGHVPIDPQGGPTATGPRSTVYVVMELLGGRSLADAFWEEGMSLADIVDVARQVCSALSASHDKSIIHRDLKLENIHLIERDGSKNFVKVLDFGIAKLLASPLSQTRTGVLLGTPAYMSPEQCRGSAEIDHRSDIYSLGIVLYELVTGTLPFAAKGFGDVLLAQMTRRPEPPSTHNPSVPASLEAIILCALEKRADDRFQSMAALRQALASVADELDSTMVGLARVQPHGRIDATTARDAHEPASTLVDAPSASAIPRVAGGLPAMATQLLPSDRVNNRETQIQEPRAKEEPPTENDERSKDDRPTEIQAVVVFDEHPDTADDAHPADLHEKKTELRAAVPEDFVPPHEHSQRLQGVSLRKALGSTDALRALEHALDNRGAPRPVLPVFDSAPHVVEYEDGERRRVRQRVLVIVSTIVVTALGLLYALR